MLIRTQIPFFIASTLIISASSAAFAQGKLGDDSGSEPEEEVLPTLTSDDDKAQHGLGLSFRYLMFPQGGIELFMEEAASGVGQPGFGLQYVNRKADREIVVGFEYANLAANNGYYVEGGREATELGSTDYIEFDGLAWMALDFTYLFHHNFTDSFSLRYGGGLGVAYVIGDVLQTDAICTGSNAQEDCSHPGGPQIDDPADFWRVPLVVNAVLGAQYRPMKNLAINIEGGLRTLLYTGANVQYFF